MPAIEMKEVTKYYGETLGVGPVSFQVNPGEFLSLLGPSGCGKTTTLRIIAGFEEPTSGDVFQNGKRINDLPPEKRDAGFVFQSYALFPHLSVFGNVAFGLKIRKMDRATIERKVRDILELVGLPGMFERYPAQLSGGQQQRVALARALVTEPAVLLLDEPLSNLDLKLRVEMRSELKRLQKRIGFTAIYVTHDQGEALTMSDRIVVLHDGGIEQVGSPYDIYERPTNEFVADFIGESNFIVGRIESDSPDLIVRTNSQMLLHLIKPSSAEFSKLNPLDVRILIRPEKIILSSEEPVDQTNAFVGQIVNSVYSGDIIRYSVRTESGQQLSVIMHSNKRSLSLKESNKVWLKLMKEDLEVVAQKPS